MPTLILFRHAKAGHAAPGQDDFDRPLTRRGAIDAAAAGRIIAVHRPDLALVSQARRTQETWAIASEALPFQPRLEVDPELYLCSVDRIAERIGEMPGDVGTLVVVGHNPDLHHLALRLRGADETQQGRALDGKFPPASVAVFTWNSNDWAASADCRLLQFWTPPVVD